MPPEIMPDILHGYALPNTFYDHKKHEARWHSKLHMKLVAHFVFFIYVTEVMGIPK